MAAENPLRFAGPLAILVYNVLNRFPGSEAYHKAVLRGYEAAYVVDSPGINMGIAIGILIQTLDDAVHLRQAARGGYERSTNLRAWPYAALANEASRLASTDEQMQKEAWEYGINVGAAVMLATRWADFLSQKASMDELIAVGIVQSEDNARRMFDEFHKTGKFNPIDAVAGLGVDIPSFYKEEIDKRMRKTNESVASMPIADEQKKLLRDAPVYIVKQILPSYGVKVS